MKNKTSDLNGPPLDWAVAKCEFGGCEDWDGTLNGVDCVSDLNGETYSPSTNWAQGGPIIEREKITLVNDPSGWTAYIKLKSDSLGPTPLISAMRCYVASNLGDEIEIPEELL